MSVGTVVQATEIPVVPQVAFNTATAFIVGVTDSGPTTQPTKVNSLASYANTFGTPTGSGNVYNSRTTNGATVFDAVETFFREGGEVAYIARVVGTSPASATLVLQDAVSATALTVTAQYPGTGGNGIYIAVANSGSAYVITLQDAQGNALATSPSLASNAAAVTWFASTGIATAVAGAGTLAKTIAATQMTGGTNGTGVTITNWQTALAQFGPSLGPGQVLAPGQTNTGLSGIWSALGTHAQNNNRVAICDMDDNTAAATEVADIGTFGTTTVASYCGFWAGNLNIPGTVPGTTRSIAPSSAIAALCARADQLGNPSLAAAGANFPLVFATGSTSLVSGTQATYNQTDLNTLNASGINTFASRFGVFENYGFVSAVLPTNDGVYWQFNHARLRMALQAEAQIIGEPFVFSQLDGQGSDTIAFGTALQGMLQTYYQRGALYGKTASDAFVVDVSPDVNTPALLAAGQLTALCSVRMSPFAQLVQITLNVVPITQAL
jgi:hypothetical protein